MKRIDFKRLETNISCSQTLLSSLVHGYFIVSHRTNNVITTLLLQYNNMILNFLPSFAFLHLRSPTFCPLPQNDLWQARTPSQPMALAFHALFVFHFVAFSINGNMLKCHTSSIFFLIKPNKGALNVCQYPEQNIV